MGAPKSLRSDPRLAITALASFAMAAVGYAGPVRAEETAGWSRPMHGVTVSLPAGWTSVYDSEEPQSIEATCETEACAKTQEVCSIVVTDEPIDFPTLMPAGWLVAATIGSERIREDVLKGSHEGATITRDPGSRWIGAQSWYVAETLARYGWKSMLHATTVINKRFVRVRCRTCDRSDSRFDFANDMLARIKVGS